MMEFEKIKERNLSTLVQYVPIVDRVHGGSHRNLMMFIRSLMNLI